MLSDTPIDACLTTAIPFDLLESSDLISNNRYHLRIHSSDCPYEGDGVFFSQFGFIEAVIGSSQRISSEYIDRTRMSPVPVGQIIFVPPNSRVRCHFTRGTRKTVSCLFDIDRMGIFDPAHWDWTDVDPATAFNIKNPFIEVALQRLAQEAAAPDHGDAILIEAALIYLAAEIKRHFDPNFSKKEFEQGKLSPQQLRRIAEILEDDEGALPSLMDLAAKLSLSGGSLSTRFHNSTGKTLRTYMSEARLSRAKRLLINDDSLMIKQIAHRSGFGSTTAFTVAFRKATGTTPREFRDSVR